jgi:hypothetical protein
MLSKIIAFGDSGTRQMKVQLDILLSELQNEHQLVIAYFCLAALSWKYCVKIPMFATTACIVSSTSRIFSAVGQRRRRWTDVITSTRGGEPF